MESYSKDPFYYKDWFLWLSLILFAPLGIFLLWKRRRFTTVSRVVVTFIFAFLFFVPFGLLNRGAMIAQNKPYEQTEFARVGWYNSTVFSWGNWFRNIFARFQPAPTPAPVPVPVPTPTGVQFTTPSASPFMQPTGTPAVPGIPGVPGVTSVPGITPAPPEQPTPTQPVPTQPAATPVVPTQPAATPAANYKWKALQDKIFELTNAERQKNGVSPLAYNAAVEKYAVAKSQDMAANNYFDHRSPTNGYFSDIWKRDGFQFSAGAENIYTMTDSRGFADRDVNSLAQSIVSGWMNSEGHRKNILNPNLKELGVGVGDNDGKLYATQLFYTR